MASRFRSSSQGGSPSGGRTAFSLRPVAIGLMVAGVAGFIAARVIFGDQVLCLLGSTLVTFAGLAMILMARRLGWARPPESPQQGQQLRVTREQVPMEEPPAAAPRQEALPPLAERAGAIFRQQGARVSVDARQDDRSILRIETRDGEHYTAMVLEDDAQVDAAEVRGLQALVASSGADGGLLISGGGFTTRAFAWVEGKPIRLVEADHLADLNI